MNLLRQEILDLIIDELAVIDAGELQTSLRNCSMANRALLPRSRKHIFRKLQICAPFVVPRPGTYSASQIVHLFNNPGLLPSIVGFVEYLLILGSDKFGTAPTTSWYHDSNPTSLATIRRNADAWSCLFAPLRNLRDVVELWSWDLSEDPHPIPDFIGELPGVKKLTLLDMLCEDRVTMSRLARVFPRVETVLVSAGPIGMVPSTLFNTEHPEQAGAVPFQGVRELLLEDIDMYELEGLLDNPFPITMQKLRKVSIMLSEGKQYTEEGDIASDQISDLLDDTRPSLIELEVCTIGDFQEYVFH